MAKQLSPDAREQMIEDAREVMDIVLKVAARRLVQSLEEVHDSNIRPLRNALKAIMAEPHGCVFCDSGKLRNPNKDHDPACGYALALDALGEAKRDAMNLAFKIANETPAR